MTPRAAITSLARDASRRMAGSASPSAGIDPKERELQIFVVELLRFYGVRTLIWYHVPNEGQRAPRTGAFYKKLGMVPGVADIALVLPGGRAAFMELKIASGRTSPEQRAFRDLCERNGTDYAIARTPEEAATILVGWGAIVTNPLRRVA